METTFTLLSESFITQIKQPPFNESKWIFQLTERQRENFSRSSRFVSLAGSDNPQQGSSRSRQVNSRADLSLVMRYLLAEHLIVINREEMGFVLNHRT